MKFLINFFTFPFRQVKKRANRTPLSPENNRKHVGKNLFFLAIAVFAIFIFRFVWLIVDNHVGGVDLAQMAKANYQNTVTVYAQRGTIFDRNGVPLAVDSSTYTIYAVLDKKQTTQNGSPQYVTAQERDKVVDFLNKNLGIDKSLAQAQLESDKSQVLFGAKGKDLSITKMQDLQKKIDDQQLVGLGFTSSVSRNYPNDNYASMLIGMTSPVTDKNGITTLKGTSGMEFSYNSILNGTNGKETYQKDVLGRPMPGTTKVITPVKNGQNVYTTLDATLQGSLEGLLDKSWQDSGGETTSATLMDAHTGEILATSQRPTATSSNITTAVKQPNFTWNSALYQTTYEPGSTMKTFLLASALDSNKVNLNATYTRTLDVYDTKISDWDWNEYGDFVLPTTVSFAQGFEMSSNTGMSKVEMQMGNTLWDNYLQRFKFGIPTRIGMTGENFGDMPSSNAVAQIQSSFGQGIGVTQIQLLRGWTAFANGGEMLQPHLVNKIVNPNNNTVLQTSPEVIGKPVSANAVNQVRNLMVGVNTNPTFGTAYLASDFQQFKAGPMFMINGQAAAVKTGTAQIASPTGGYLTGKQDTINSAVVMYPAQNPDYIFYMSVKIPSKTWTLGWISEVANPLIEQAEQLKNQDSATSTDLPAGKVKVDDYIGQSPGTTSDVLRRNLLAPVVIGQGAKITAQSIKAGSSVGANTRILLLTAGDEVMPDMYKWSKSQVEQLAKWYGLKVTYQGSGNSVSTQSITAETDIKKGQSLTVKMN